MFIEVIYTTNRRKKAVFPLRLPQCNSPTENLRINCCFSRHEFPLLIIYCTDITLDPSMNTGGLFLTTFNIQARTMYKSHIFLLHTVFSECRQPT